MAIGTRNRGLNFQRLKDKLGDHSNASSEVEYNNAWGVMIGKEGRGVNTIIEMVSHTRLDCAVGKDPQLPLSHTLLPSLHHYGMGLKCLVWRKAVQG